MSKSINLPVDEDGDIIISAEFGEHHMVRITYLTDFDGREIDPGKEEYPATLHGPFDSHEEAVAWMDAYPDGDTDIEDMVTIVANRVRPPFANKHKGDVVQVVADYQMMGDMDGREWAHLVLGDAQRTGKILNYEVLHSLTTAYGIQVVTFTVDFGTDDFENLDYKQAKVLASQRLNGEVIHDSDVSVRAIGTVNQD